MTLKKGDRLYFYNNSELGFREITKVNKKTYSLNYDLINKETLICNGVQYYVETPLLKIEWKKNILKIYNQELKTLIDSIGQIKKLTIRFNEDETVEDNFDNFIYSIEEYFGLLETENEVYNYDYWED